MKSETTITTGPAHGLQLGDIITMSQPDSRLWRRMLWRLMLRKGQPQRRVAYCITGVTTSSVSAAPARSRS